MRPNGCDLSGRGWVPLKSARCRKPVRCSEPLSGVFALLRFQLSLTLEGIPGKECRHDS